MMLLLYSHLHLAHMIVIDVWQAIIMENIKRIVETKINPKYATDIIGTFGHTFDQVSILFFGRWL